MSMLLIFLVLFEIFLCIIWGFDIFDPFDKTFIFERSFLSLKNLFVFVEFKGSSCDGDIGFGSAFGELFEKGFILELNIQDSIELSIFSESVFGFDEGRVPGIEGRLDRFYFFFMDVPIAFGLSVGQQTIVFHLISLFYRILYA